jgi:hypothetical protein
VNVIRHQDVGVQLTAVPGARGRKATPEELVISWSFEECRSVVASLNDVLGLARDVEAWKSRHWCAGNGAAVPPTAVTGPEYAGGAANSPPVRFRSERDIPVWKFDGVRLH